MGEEEYMDMYSYRLFKIHLGAHFKNTFLPFATIAEAFTGGSKGKETAVVDKKTGKTKKVANLPPWFKRKPGRRYSIISNEGSLGRLRRASETWTQGSTAFHLT